MHEISSSEITRLVKIKVYIILYLITILNTLIIKSIILSRTQINDSIVSAMTIDNYIRTVHKYL